MRKMEDSGVAWIGEIPEDWEVASIKHMFTVVNGSTPKSDNPDYWGGDIIWITPAEMSNISSTIIDSLRKITQSGLESCGTTIVPAGSIVLSTRAPIGLVCIAGVPLCTNQGCKSLQCFSDINQKFYYYFFQIQTESLNMLVRGTTFLELSSSCLGNFLVPFPSVSKQNQIVTYLDAKCSRIDSTITNIRTLIDKLKEYKQSVITQAVTKGLDPDAPMKDSGVPWIGEIPEDWEVWRLKFLLSEPLQYGANASGVIYNSDLPRYIRITDIRDDGTLSEDNIQSLPYEHAKNYILYDNDLLFARSGATVGKSFIYKKEYGLSAFAGYLIRAKADSNICRPKFIFYFSQSYSYQEWKNSIFIQATIQNIGASKYSNLEIPLPNITAQDIIISYLDKKCAQIDSQIAEQETLLTKLESYKKSLIYECVTGKRDIQA